MRYDTVLLIDDDVDEHFIFKSALKIVSEKMVFMGITNGREALEKLKAKQVLPKVIFLDLNMPIMTGQQFLLEIKREEELKDLPIIVFSTTSNQTTIQLTKELGAHDFLTKPGNFNLLVSKLKAILN